jgi:hypothetical protein
VVKARAGHRFSEERGDGAPEAAIELLWQKGARGWRQWLNGGGTIPTFTGARGLLWADNDLDAERLSLTASLNAPIGDLLRLDLALGGSRHRRAPPGRPPRSTGPIRAFTVSSASAPKSPPISPCSARSPA